jgi:uncharacterized protein (DUF4415 family)
MSSERASFACRRISLQCQTEEPAPNRKNSRPVLNWNSAEIGKFHRPTKRPVTIRLDSDVIAWLEADGRGYQTKANWLLRHAVLHYTREKGPSKREAFRRKPRQQKGKA